MIVLMPDFISDPIADSSTCWMKQMDVKAFGKDLKLHKDGKEEDDIDMAGRQKSKDGTND